MKYICFYLFWLLSSPIGFIIGSHLGATNDGLIPDAIPGYAGLILGDLIFGAAVGSVQWLVIRLTHFIKISARWIGFTSLGFMMSARSGSLLTYRLVELHEWLEPSFVFGIFMGSGIGMATFLAIHSISARKYLIWWLAVSIFAWILGEGIAFKENFVQSAVPQVAFAISSVTGLGLACIQYLASPRNKMTGIEVTPSTTSFNTE